MFIYITIKEIKENLTIKERKAMQEMQSRNDIVITDADKG